MMYRTILQKKVFQFVTVSTTTTTLSVLFCNQYTHSDSSITSLRNINKSQVDLNGYNRIDDKLLHLIPKDHIAKNAVHGTLTGNSLIEVYEIYFNKKKEELLCLIHFGTELNGHPEVVHGGITATVFDNSFGWLYMASKFPAAFTASLNVNYRKKVSEDSTVVLRARVKEAVGRKLYFEATMHDLNGALLADSTSLFISVKKTESNNTFGNKKSSKESTELSSTVNNKPMLSSEVLRQQLFVSRGIIYE